MWRAAPRLPPKILRAGNLAEAAQSHRSGAPPALSLPPDALLRRRHCRVAAVPAHRWLREYALASPGRPVERIEWLETVDSPLFFDRPAAAAPAHPRQP